MAVEHTRPTGSEPEYVSERFTATAEQEGSRLDAAVAAWTGLSRSAAAQLCAEERVSFRGRPAPKSHRVGAAETYTVQVPVPEDQLPVGRRPERWQGALQEPRVARLDHPVVEEGDHPTVVAAATPPFLMRLT